MRTWLRRPSLLTKFSVLSLLVISALGIGVGSMLHRQIEKRALAEATRLAEVMTSAGVQPILLRGDLELYPTEQRLSVLDEEFHLRGFDNLGIRRLKLFNAEGRIVYSDDRGIIGEVHPDSPGVRSALAGRVERNVKYGTFDNGRGVHSLEAYVPVKLAGDEIPDGV